MRDGDAGLRAEIEASEGRLEAAIAGVRTDMRDGDAALRADVKAGEAALRADVKACEAALRADVKACEAALRADVKAGEAKLEDIGREMRAGFTNVTQRISRLEGVIEGRSSEARDQQQEGVA